MKKFLVIMLSLMMMVIVGCSQNEAKEEVNSKLFTESVEKGKLAIAEKDYTLASSMFELALEEKEDEEISKLKQQCDLVIEMVDIASQCEDLDENIDEISEQELNVIIEDLKKIPELCDKIISIDTDSKLIIDLAKEAKIEINKSIKEIDKLLAEYEADKVEEVKKSTNNTSDKDTDDNDTDDNDTDDYDFEEYGGFPKADGFNTIDCEGCGTEYNYYENYKCPNCGLGTVQ